MVTWLLRLKKSEKKHNFKKLEKIEKFNRKLLKFLILKS